MKSTRETVRRETGQSSSSRASIDLESTDGRISYDREKIAYLINDHLIYTFKQLGNTEKDLSFLIAIHKPTHQLLNFDPKNIDEMLKIIRTLEPRKSAGLTDLLILFI